jgi:hypothetical protein
MPIICFIRYNTRMVEAGRIIGPDREGEARDRVGLFLSRLTPTGETLQGEANINRVYVRQDGAKFLHRKPKDRAGVINVLEEWYKGVGFTDMGGGFRYLSNSEQAEKMDHMQSLSLKTVVPVVSVGEEMILPFIEGETLLEYIKGGKTDVVPDVIDHLLLAHQKDVVLGDRWTPNTIVTPDGDFREIDFDIELSGRYAKEFELSQLLYSLVVYSSSRRVMMGVMQDYLPKRKDALQSYDKNALAVLLRGHARHLEGQIFEGCIHNIGDEVEEMVALIS